MNVSSRTVVLINVFAAVGLFTLISMRFGWFIWCSDFARSTYCQRNQCSDSTQDHLILLRSAILSLMFNHDVADDGVILQPIKWHILAVTRKFLPTVRHFTYQHEMGIDPGTTILQPCADAMRPAHIFRPYRRCKSVLAVIRPVHHLFFVVEGRNTHYWTKYLFLHDGIVL